MKITIVQGAFLPVPPLMGGAVEKVWFRLGQEFARAGHEVTHISRQYPGLARQEIIAGVRHLRVAGYDTPRSMTRLKALDLAYSIRAFRALPDADILVTNTFWLPMLARSQRKGALYVHVARYPKGQMRFYRHARRLQTVSAPIAKAITGEIPDCEAQVRVIPYPLPFDVPVAEEETLAPSREKWLLYVGRVHAEKGIDLLLDAFQSLLKQGIEDYRLVIVGPWETRLGGGGQAYYNSMRAKAKAYESRVDWIGPVFDAEELACYYQKASVFVYPSLAEKGETFGLAPLEAMAYGCPPVVSSLECFRDFIEPGCNGYIFDHRAAGPFKELADTLTRLLHAETNLQKGREAGLLTVKNFTVTEVAERYLADFHAILA